MSKTAKNLFVRVRACLCESDVDEKLRLATELADDWQAGRLLRQPVELEDVVEAGRPKKPELVPPRQLKRCQPWRAKRGLVIPGSREAALLTRRARSAPEGKQSRHPNTASSQWE
ncbi:MAG: hypothetical protein RPU12_02340, partial [Candidatus Sedimenticola sp. (ex Thyasira tokunagai)]